MKISQNFYRYEMACGCGCGFDTCDIELNQLLEWIRHKIGPFTPSSVCRCVEYNEKIQKEKNKNYVPYSSKSQHLYARAADISGTAIKRYGIEKLYGELLDNFPFKYGFGIYNWGIHVDSRNAIARWDFRT